MLTQKKLGKRQIGLNIPAPPMVANVHLTPSKSSNISLISFLTVEPFVNRKSETLVSIFNLMLPALSAPEKSRSYKNKNEM